MATTADSAAMSAMAQRLMGGSKVTANPKPLAKATITSPSPKAPRSFPTPTVTQAVTQNKENAPIATAATPSIAPHLKVIPPTTFSEPAFTFETPTSSVTSPTPTMSPALTERNMNVSNSGPSLQGSADQLKVRQQFLPHLLKRRNS
jgi:hypothetical protein